MMDTEKRMDFLAEEIKDLNLRVEGLSQKLAEVAIETKREANRVLSAFRECSTKHICKCATAEDIKKMRELVRR